MVLYPESLHSLFGMGDSDPPSLDRLRQDDSRCFGRSTKKCRRKMKGCRMMEK